MGKAGEKQKRRPKFKDNKQAERFKEIARQLGADESGDVFDRVIKEMARAKDDAREHIKSSREHIKSAADKIPKAPDEISDAQWHVRKSADAVKRSKRLLKKAKD